MPIQHRRGSYDKLLKAKISDGEFVFITSDDPNALDGKAVYAGFGNESAKRMATYEDMPDYLSTVIEDANEIIVADMVEKTALAGASAAKADTAAGSANAAASSAATAASNANEAYKNYQENKAASADTADRATTAGTADKLKTPRKIDGVSFDGSTDIVHCGYCTTAVGVAAKTVDIPGFTLINNAFVIVHFSNPITTANTSLNVSGTGAYPIRYGASALPANVVAAHKQLLLRYYSTNWYVVGDLNGVENADSGWIDATLGSAFEKYSASSAVRYRKIGNRVIIEGNVKPKAEIAGSPTATAIFTLPAGYRPPITRGCICQGSMVNNWFLTVQPDGTVGAARYGTTSVSAIPTSASLSFYFEFLID